MKVWSSRDRITLIFAALIIAAELHPSGRIASWHVDVRRCPSQTGERARRQRRRRQSAGRIPDYSGSARANIQWCQASATTLPDAEFEAMQWDTSQRMAFSFDNLLASGNWATLVRVRHLSGQLVSPPRHAKISPPTKAMQARTRGGARETEDGRTATLELLNQRERGRRGRNRRMCVTVVG